MAASRRGKKTDDQPADAVRFTPLDGSGWEDSGYLPSDDDQSWREMEALRIGAYDRIGHLPPKGNQSWREQEALRLSTAREAAETDNTNDVVDTGNANTGNADAVVDRIADLAKPDSFAAAEPVPEAVAGAIAEPAKPDSHVPASYVPVREPVAVSTSRGGGGVMLLLVAVVGLVTVALAVPGLLTPEFWRAQWAMVAGKPAVAMPERVASIPAPAVRPAPQAAPVGTPALNTAPPTNSEPTASAEPQAATEPPATTEPTADATPDATPSPRPETRPGTHEDRTMVIGQDGTVKYEDAAAGSKRAQSRRAAVPDDAGGFYAMAPGPDGKLQRQFFPSTPKPGSGQAARAPSRDDTGGVYAMAPGPDGKLTYQYFPAKPR